MGIVYQGYSGSPQDVATYMTERQIARDQIVLMDCHYQPGLGTAVGLVWQAPRLDPPVSEKIEDEEAARLIALNMLLNRAAPEEVLAYLRANFSLADPEGLVRDLSERASRPGS